MTRHSPHRHQGTCATSGFSLAELLIALVIVAEIAAFTIPKVLYAQQNTSYRAAAKEAVGMVTGAYATYQQSNVPGSATRSADLTPFMNYVRIDTTSTIDQVQTGGIYACTSTPCLVLHNGGRLRYSTTDSFGGTGPTNALWFQFDPDGKVTDGTTNGPGKSIEFDMYYNGRITTWGTCANNTVDSNNVPWNPLANHDPPWFAW